MVRRMVSTWGAWSCNPTAVGYGMLPPAVYVMADQCICVGCQPLAFAALHVQVAMCVNSGHGLHSPATCMLPGRLALAIALTCIHMPHLLSEVHRIFDEHAKNDQPVK